MGIRILQDSSCHKYVLVLMCNVMAGTKHTISCLSSLSHSQLITCQEISGITMGSHIVWLHIIPLLKVSDCTEIITREIDSGISLKILSMLGGFEERNGFFRGKEGESKDDQMKEDERETQR